MITPQQAINRRVTEAYKLEIIKRLEEQMDRRIREEITPGGTHAFMDISDWLEKDAFREADLDRHLQRYAEAGWRTARVLSVVYVLRPDADWSVLGSNVWASRFEAGGAAVD